MIRAIIFFSLFTLYNYSFGQQFAWGKTIGSTDSEFGNGIAADDSGNVYLTGYFRGTVDFDPGPGTNNLISAGDQDIYFLKLDAFGNFLWAHQMGNSWRESGEAVSVDDEGNVYFTGYFRDTIYPDRNDPSFSLISSEGGNLFVVKLDPSGNVIWASQTNSSNNKALIIPTDIEIDQNKNAYISGFVSGTVSIDSIYLSGNSGAVGEGEAFLLKLDSSGNYLLNNQIHGTGNSNLIGLAIDNNENIYAAGNIEGQVNYNHPVQGNVNLSANGRTDFILCRFHANGDFDWLNQFGAADFDSGNDVALDGKGGLYVTGHFSNSVDFDPDTTSTVLTAAGTFDLTDIFMARYEVNGDFDWVKQLGTFNSDKGKTILVDDSANIYLGGDFEQSSDFDPGSGSYPLYAYGDEEIFIAKYDSLGNFIWAEEIGGNGADYGSDLYLDNLGNIYSCGSFTNNTFFDRRAQSPIYVPSAGSFDILLAKYTQNLSVGIQQNRTNDYRIFPNPTEGILKIQQMNTQVELVRLFNVEGKLVFEKSVVNKSNPISLELDMKTGIYFIQLHTSKGIQNQKIIFK